MLKKISLILLLATTPLFAYAAASQVNINTASKHELMKDLNGITSSEANAIIKYRKKNGAFVSLHDLTFADGPGSHWARKLITSNYGKMTVGNVSAANRT